MTRPPVVIRDRVLCDELAGGQMLIDREVVRRAYNDALRALNSFSAG